MKTSAIASIDEALHRDGIPVFCTVPQAALAANLGCEAITRLCRAGVIEAVRTPAGPGRLGQWRITRSSLAMFLTGVSALETNEMPGSIGDLEPPSSPNARLLGGGEDV